MELYNRIMQCVRQCHLKTIRTQKNFPQNIEYSLTRSKNQELNISDTITVFALLDLQHSYLRIKVK